MKLISKFLRYVEECLFCLKVGFGFIDKITLVRETLAFHWNKKDGRAPRIIQAQVRLGKLIPILKIRDSGGDMFIFHEVLKDEVYRIKPKWLGHPPETIVDLGANIGLTTLALASQFSKARFIAVEPNPDSEVLLRQNLACLGSQVRVWKVAISNRKGKARLNLANEAYNSSLIREYEHGVEVDVVTLAEILKAEKIEHIDILKIDIEGAEKMLLKGSPKWLEMVDLILIEMHDGYGFPELEKDLHPAGFVVSRMGSAQAVARRKP